MDSYGDMKSLLANYVLLFKCEPKIHLSANMKMIWLEGGARLDSDGELDFLWSLLAHDVAFLLI